MKRVIAVVVLLGVLSCTIGCQGTKSRAIEGSVIGGVLGAAGGGIIGHQSGHAGEGAAIGAAAGAITGAIVGSQIEKPQEQPTAVSNVANASQMTVKEIVDLNKQGLGETAIIDKIRQTNSTFTLTTEDISYLQQQGVSQKVINAMQGK